MGEKEKEGKKKENEENGSKKKWNRRENKSRLNPSVPWDPLR